MKPVNQPSLCIEITNRVRKTYLQYRIVILMMIAPLQLIYNLPQIIFCRNSLMKNLLSENLHFTHISMKKLKNFN